MVKDEKRLRCIMQEVSLKEQIKQAADAICERLDGRQPKIGIVLGSGLGPLANQIENAVRIPFGDIPFMKTSTATSHVGQFVCGMLSGKCVIAMQGRLHGYEGYTPQQVAFPIWVMNALGVRVLITTNAAGAINESYAPGEFCIMKDHINFTGRNPIVGQDPNEIAGRFFSMYEAYDPELRALAKEIAQRKKIAIQEGVYLGLLGPSFETPAEIRAFRGWGADTVAMSVCEEVIAARHVDMRVLGISLISNMACGIDNATPNDSEVLEVANRSSKQFCALIAGCVNGIPLS